jgi:hypothetical protein
MKRATLTITLLASATVAAVGCGLSTSGLGTVADGEGLVPDAMPADAPASVQGADATTADGSLDSDGAADVASSVEGSDASSPSAPGDADAMTLADGPSAAVDAPDDAETTESSSPVDSGCSCGTGCSPVTDCSTCPATAVLCNGTCVADCSACSAAPLLCGALGACQSDCTSCPNAPVECFSCAAGATATAAAPAHGSCEAQDASSFCLGGYASYANSPYASGGYANHCQCYGGVQQCPGDTQVCTPYVGCETCGERASGYEPGTNSTQVCKNGMRCDPTTAQCSGP